MEPQEFQKVLFLTVQALNSSIFPKSFLTSREIFVGPNFFSNQLLSLYINPKINENLPELQDLVNLTKSNILKQKDNILAIFQQRKNYLLKKHLQNREFKGNIFFERGSLVKKISKFSQGSGFPFD